MAKPCVCCVDLPKTEATLAEVTAERDLLRVLVRELAEGAALWLHDGPGTTRVVSGAGATHLYDFELDEPEAALFDAVTKAAI